jgi:cell division protein FtsQ
VIVPVTLAADRRFLRAQVKPGRRQAPWRTWLRLAIVVGIAAVVIGLAVRGVVAALSASMLRVAQVEVSGTQHLSKGDVLALVDGLRGQNILRVRLDDYRRRLLASPWVADATISRSLPATIVVRVVERRPMAIGRVGEDLFLVDEHGDEIDEYGPRYSDFDLPIIDGLVRGAAQEAGVNERRVQLASNLLREVRRRPDLARRISQVDVSDPRDAVVIIDQDTARIRLGDERFLERLQSYLDLAQTLRAQVPAIDYVDLRFGERVYVGAQASAAPVQAQASAAKPGGAKGAPGKRRK